MRKPAILRQLLKETNETGKILTLPGAHDVLTARIIEQLGFSCVYMTGYGTAASMLGRPDVGLLTLTEMAAHAHNMAAAVEIPVIADADTGYGNAINVIRTVREYEAAGVAALQLEDQVMPKKCGHMLGRDVIPMEEMVGKIKAAVSARQDPDLCLIARTDARTRYGIEEAIRRGQAYEKAGADIIFIESPESIEEMKLITASFGVPVLANMLENGRTPFLSTAELEKLGYQIALYCLSTTYAAAKAVYDTVKALKEQGTTREVQDKMITFAEFNRLIGLSEIRELEKEYVADLNPRSRI